MDAFMQTFLQQFRHLKIQLEEITSATNNFDDQNNRIGVGGFGKVYKGELSHSKGRSMVAIKRLDPTLGQGIPEFLKEITMLSNYKHESLISLLGFCYEGGEMILVYEHASRGSLDRHLKSHHVTWSQRLKICIDAARGLTYLHDPREAHQRLIHCDIKSANILLDDQWNAKVSDFGLSIMGSANEQQSVIVTLAAGTRGYCDPQYAMTNTLTKESDVYSFGVVLFEVLCGTLCYTYSNGLSQILVPTWIKSYEQKILYDIIFKNPTIQPLDQGALETFSNIAYRCLNISRDDRPNMAEVVTELEAALECQKFSEMKQLFDYEVMAKTAQPPLHYSSKGELWKLLSKGVLLNGGNTWFSLNKKEEHYQMISFAECLDSELKGEWSFEYNSRFVAGTYLPNGKDVKTRVRSPFLSASITYSVNLVFKFTSKKVEGTCHLTHLRYKLQGETEYLTSHLAYKREDGWWMCELYRFTSDHATVDHEILFEQLDKLITLEGIEFCPLEKVDHVDEKQPDVSDSDANWEEILPSDYEDMMRWSINSAHQAITKKEAYSVIRKGFLIDPGEKWLFLDKNGKKCHMMSARATGLRHDLDQLFSLPESRFGEAFECTWYLRLESEILVRLLSFQTTYASYLVYKLPKDHRSEFEGPIELEYTLSPGPGPQRITKWYIFLVSPETPEVCRRKEGDQSTHKLASQYRAKVKGLPQQRSDGWMEVQIWEFQTPMRISPMSLPTNYHFYGPRDDNDSKIRMNLLFKGFSGKKLNGLIIEGIEFRPISSHPTRDGAFFSY